MTARDEVSASYEKWQYYVVTIIKISCGVCIHAFVNWMLAALDASSMCTPSDATL